jgi:hypothetical protein
MVGVPSQVPARQKKYSGSGREEGYTTSILLGKVPQRWMAGRVGGLILSEIQV